MNHLFHDLFIIADAQPMNIYHEALLCWNFHTGADRGKIEFGNAVEKLWLNKVPSFKVKKGLVNVFYR